MMKSLNNQFTSNEIELAFRQFDHDGDRSITWQEFKLTFEKIQQSFEDVNRSKQVIKKLVAQLSKSDSQQIKTVFDQISQGIGSINYE